MSKGERKKDKREYQKVKEEWIEMEDLNEPKNQTLNKKFAIEEGTEYQNSRLKQEKETEASRTKQAQALKQQQTNKNTFTQPSKNPYDVIEIKQRRQRKKPSLPMTEVTCDYCTVPQSVPGNTQVYICGSCENMNECYPLYGVVICGCCQSKLGFGFGMSEYIKCPKCASINKVPLEAPKNYDDVGPVVKEKKEGLEKGRKERERDREEEFVYSGFEREGRQESDLI